MLKKTLQILSIIVILVSFVKADINKNIKPDSLSRATPKALKKKFPKGISLSVIGKVKKEYILSNKDLSKYSSVRLRSREVLENGNVNGAYIYHGIPVFSILEGISPYKTDNDLFDRPLDLIVAFKSATGRETYFSYGELIMCDDNNPVILAFEREEVLPSKSPETYKKNKNKGALKGLKLVCTGDYYTDRYLNNVVSIELRPIKVARNLLPSVKKGMKCESSKLYAVCDNKQKDFVVKNPIIVKKKQWFRIGHGRGIKGLTYAKVEGFLLKNLLKKNFIDCNKKDFFLFVGCDGYRTLVSGYEIFESKRGEDFILITKLNGKKIKNTFTLGILSDYFVDRDVRELTHIEIIKKY